MAAFESTSGTFAAPLATGAQAITGLGFEPKALVLIVMDDGLDATGATARSRGCFGFTDGTTSRVSEWGVNQLSNLTRSDRSWASSVLEVKDHTGDVLLGADLDSFDADGFTLDWTTINGDAALVMYWAIGGDDVDAKVLEWTLPATVGPASITGVGFQPDLTIHISALHTAAGGHGDNAYRMIGACDAELDQVLLCSGDQHGVSPSQSKTYTSDHRSVGARNVAGTHLFSATQTSMDADGFSLNFAYAGPTYKVATLALAGVGAKVGEFKKTKNVLGNQVVSGVGVKPVTVMHLWNAQATPANYTPGASWLVSGWTVGFGLQSDDAGDPASGFSHRTDGLVGAAINTVAYINDNRAIVPSGPAGTLLDIAQGDIASFNTDGFTVGWADQNTLDPWLFYIALMGSHAPTAPTPQTPVDGSTINRGITNRFRWVFNDPDAGDSQSKFDLQVRLVGDVAWTTGSVETPTPYYDVPGGTLFAGDYEWRVRTYDAVGNVSPYSSIQTFTAADPPDAPTITYPTNGGTISVEFDSVTWSGPDQEAYEARRVADDAGSPDDSTVYETSGVVESAIARSHALDFDTNGRTEHVQVRVRKAGVWGDWASVIVDVSYTGPAVPTIVVEADQPTGAISVQAEHPGPTGGQPTVERMDLWRRLLTDDGDGIRIAADLAPSDIYTDWAVAHRTEYAYRWRAYGDNGTSTWSVWSAESGDVDEDIDGGTPGSTFEDELDPGGP